MPAPPLEEMRIVASGSIVWAHDKNLHLLDFPLFLWTKYL
jgi:hypothetical protein